MRAAGQPHRLRLTRARFGRPSRPLPRALIAPCLKHRALTMDVCRAPSKALPKLCSAWLSSVNWPDLDVREGRHARMIRPMVGTPHGWACLDRAQTSCSARSSHARLAQHDAPRVMCSAFEGECGTLFDVQTSLTVVYDAPKPPHDTRSQHSAQVSLQLPYTGRMCA